MRALICGVDPTLAHHVSITKCKMPNMRQNLHKFMPLLKPAPKKRKPSVSRVETSQVSLRLEQQIRAFALTLIRNAIRFNAALRQGQNTTLSAEALSCFG